MVSDDDPRRAVPPAPSVPAAAMEPRRPRWRRGAAAASVVVGFAVSVVTWTCRVGGGEGEVDDGYDRRPLLTSVVEQVILPAHEDAVVTAEALEVVTAAYLDALEGGDAEAIAGALAEAQEAWRTAMSAWQQVEVLQVGPAGSSIERLGGEDRRDAIYSWPTVNSCRVDQETVEEGFAAADFFTANLVNVYGLDAAEYLLFVDTTDNSCDATAPINVDGTWDALGDGEIRLRRARYALRVTGGVAEEARGLRQAWLDGFAQELTNPHEGGVYADTRVALDELFAAMFYVDLVTKDKKIGVPNGGGDCGADLCLDRLESPWADHARENVCSNLEVLQRAIWGGPSPEEGTGFDDYLRFVGDDDLAAQLDDALATAIATCEGLGMSLHDALLDDPAAVDALWAAVKAVTDLLKVDVVVALSLEVPGEGAGDAD